MNTFATKRCSGGYEIQAHPPQGFSRRPHSRLIHFALSSLVRQGKLINKIGIGTHGIVHEGEWVAWSRSSHRDDRPWLAGDE